jgi:hypothetical protein
VIYVGIHLPETDSQGVYVLFFEIFHLSTLKIHFLFECGGGTPIIPGAWKVEMMKITVPTTPWKRLVRLHFNK